MNTQVQAVIEELEKLDTQKELEEPLYRISRENGIFLNTLIRMSKSKRILEIGSSSGYSGLFLAEAARDNGGTVTTCELSPFKIKLARTSYEQAGLEQVITLIEGDAKQLALQLTGPCDFVFIDAWKDDYAHYLEAVWPKVAPGGVVTADDIVSQMNQPGIQAYLQLAQSLSDATTVTVPIDDGVEVTYKQG